MALSHTLYLTARETKLLVEEVNRLVEHQLIFVGQKYNWPSSYLLAWNSGADAIVQTFLNAVNLRWDLNPSDSNGVIIGVN